MMNNNVIVHLVLSGGIDDNQKTVNDITKARLDLALKNIK